MKFAQVKIYTVFHFGGPLFALALALLVHQHNTHTHYYIQYYWKSIWEKPKNIMKEKFFFSFMRGSHWPESYIFLFLLSFFSTSFSFGSQRHCAVECTAAAAGDTDRPTAAHFRRVSGTRGKLFRIDGRNGWRSGKEQEEYFFVLQQLRLHSAFGPARPPLSLPYRFQAFCHGLHRNQSTIARFFNPKIYNIWRASYFLYFIFGKFFSFI